VLTTEVGRSAEEGGPDEVKYLVPTALRRSGITSLRYAGFSIRRDAEAVQHRCDKGRRCRAGDEDRTRVTSLEVIHAVTARGSIALDWLPTAYRRRPIVAVRCGPRVARRSGLSTPAQSLREPLDRLTGRRAEEALIEPAAARELEGQQS
jgi:hypothetical protein